MIRFVWFALRLYFSFASMQPVVEQATAPAGAILKLTENWKMQHKE
jgi:hypothetical protein